MKILQQKTKLEGFKERIKEPEELYRILFEKFREIENLKTTVRRLQRIIDVNINSKKLIMPNEIKICSPDDSVYLPSSSDVCRINQKEVNTNLFENSNN